MKITNLILGAGITGLSLSHLIGHSKCLLLEQKGHVGGHCSSFEIGGIVWDEGPHVSFTNDKFVLDLFKESVDGKYIDLDISAGNYWYGHWLPHPIQMYLSYLPESVNKECLADFLLARTKMQTSSELTNYRTWVDANLGQAIRKHFVERYTQKYWKCSSEDLSTNWIGPRVRVPSLDEIIKGANERSNDKHHYVQKAIYPQEGGFQKFMGKIAKNANVIFDTKIQNIDLERKTVTAQTGETYSYDRLLSSIPLTTFISALNKLPEDVAAAAKSLRCTSVSLVNVTTHLPPKVDYHWFYVYDEDMMATRVTSQHLLSGSQFPPGMYGYQVEIYSKFNTREHPQMVISRVISELQRLGLVDEVVSQSYRFIPYANVIPDVDRADSLELILAFLSNYGLIRELNDTHPIHSEHDVTTSLRDASLVMLGRYAQWSYGWTDDCIKRANSVTSRI